MRRLDLVLFIVPSSSRLAALPAVLQSAILSWAIIAIPALVQQSKGERCSLLDDFVW